MTLSGHPCALTTFLLNNESIIPVQTVKYAVSCPLKIGKAVSVVQKLFQLPVFRFYVAVVNPGTIYLNKGINNLCIPIGKQGVELVIFTYV